MDERRVFLEKLLSPAFGSGLFCYVLGLWGKQPEERFFAAGDIDGIIDFCERRSKSNLYISGALWARPLPKRDDKEIAALLALRLDIDVAGPGHKKPGLPPTMQDAKILIAKIGAPPTIVVDSGHGLQAWYVLREPMMLDTPEARASAEQMSLRLGATLAARAREKGWTVDSVHDLGRVMRIAGTCNYKEDIAGQPLPPAPARFVDASNPWNPSEIDPFLIEAPAPRARSETAAVDLVVDPSANPPFERFQALSDNDRKFKKAWDRARPDLQDQSLSGYDMALASLAAKAEWSDQEICDLLVAFARRHGGDAKRAAYYAHTIGKAREPMEHEREQIAALEQIETTAASSQDLDEGERGRTLDALEKLLGFRIDRVVKRVGFWEGRQNSESSYWLIADGVEIEIGSASSMLRQDTFRSKVYDAASFVIPRFKPNERWDRVVRSLTKIVEVEDTGRESTERGRVETWLDAYIADFPPRGDWQDSVKWRGKTKAPPFLKDGRIHFHGPHLRHYLATALNEMITAREMGGLLRAAGLENITVSLRTDSGVQGSRVWLFTPVHPTGGE